MTEKITTHRGYLQEAIASAIAEMRDNEWLYQGVMTLGELAIHMQYQDKNAQIIIEVDGTRWGAGDFDSYRGYYSHIALSRKEERSIVRQLRAQVAHAIDSQFQGYKGGDYRMYRSTPVWIAEYGECSDIGLVKVKTAGGAVVLVGHKFGR